MRYFLLLGAGFAAGTYGSLVGLGGGFLIVPTLICLYKSLSPERITAISLSIISVSSLSATTAYIKLRKVDLKAGGFIALFQIPVMIVGSILTKYISIKPFSFSFGVFLIALSIFLILKPAGRRTPEGKSKPDPKILAIAGILTGTLSSLFGIGGGVILVPTLSKLYGMETHRAVATSLFTLFFSSLTGAITHIFMVNGFSHLYIAIPLGIGVILGSQLGARSSEKFKGKILMRLLSIGIAIAGIKLIERGLG